MTTAIYSHIYCLLNRMKKNFGGTNFRPGRIEFLEGDVTLSWDETEDLSILTEYA